ncbi:BMP family lipoprotein [Bacillus sp. FJAT-45350]|uniref:BMP family lipoprotein n=1 Tax=Bacillus sp. FJAT-45350 TaxID=2011014 RepID=UPI000BB6C062|nr:BMP family ABC transporter substrate-binding protein [Bacillus sp. FJAT-45350]
MMKNYHLFLLLLFLFGITGCGQSQVIDSVSDKVKIGLMLDSGLGDQSFNDAAFMGVMKARDELDIIFEYRQLSETGTYLQGFNELMDEGCDLIIGLEFNMIEDLTYIASEYPEQQFLILGGVIDLPNVTSLTFRDEQGSFIVGAIAGLQTDKNNIGFIGGMDIPVIKNIKNGYIAGVKAVSPETNIIVEYTHDFRNAEIAKDIARQMIEKHDIEIIYVAAGFSGLGAIEEIAHQQKYAIGVDSDQFFLAESAVITSMIKKIDVAIYTAIEELIEHGHLPEEHMVFGIAEDGVGAAPIRVITLSKEHEALVESLTKQLIDGSITINP